ncbi:septation ring formation regulator EzrA [Gemelliphila palaticanis]|uniref:Selenide, water dikinase n=1 Tax=Gemelliphila palaticanis TaxID=81950 RepID=A0ABX2SYA6_9BACL|nr:septation ring formation regulator EzrA [Gemella palaticanis]MBF0715234.1 selenide, water dikinase [Gemella palaticanis]NYS47164.1 selenide, water dikinase [Gemella palaticanis]
MVYFYGIILIVLILGIVYLFVLKSRKKDELLPLKAIQDELERETLSDELKQVKNLNLSGKAQNWYEDWESSWYEIQSIDIEELDKDLYQADEYIDKFNFKKADEIIFNCGENIASIKGKIETIRSEIKQLSEIEPKNKEKYEDVVREYKDLNREILAKRHQYGAAADGFEEEIKLIAPKLESFKSMTSSGKFIEAEEIIDEVNLEVIDLKERISILPEILKEIEKTTPAQIQALKLKIEEMEKKGFKLSHLEISSKIENCVWQLNEAREKVKSGNIDLIENILDGIYDIIDEVSNSLKKEIEYKKFIEENYSIVKDKLDKQDRLNEALYNNIQEIKNRYHIYSEDEEMINKNYDHLSNLIEVKKDIDVYISNQPRLNYKDLKEKVQVMINDLEEIEESQTNYSKYLTGLREEELYSREKLNYINQEKEIIRRKLSNSRVPGFSDRFVVLYKEVTDSYKYAVEELKKEPMNIDLVRESVAEALESLNIYKTEVHSILTDIELIEKLIRYTNRYRKDNLELHKQLNIAEQYYKEYRYNKTLEIIKTALDKVDNGAYDKIRREVKERIQ